MPEDKVPNLSVVHKLIEQRVLDGKIAGVDLFTQDQKDQALRELADLYSYSRIDYQQRRNQLQPWFGCDKRAIDYDVQQFIERNRPLGLPGPDVNPVSELVAIGRDCDLWRNRLEQCFATFERDEHIENHAINTGKFKHYLSDKYSEVHQTELNGELVPLFPEPEDLKKALWHIHNYALRDREKAPKIRVTEWQNELWIDLGRQDWSCVVVNGDDWRIESRMLAPLIRAPGMMELPIPERGGDINDLCRFVNLPDRSDLILLCGQIAGIYNVFGHYKITVISGPPGSAKTFIVRVMRALSDPNEIDTRSPPDDVRDLWHGAVQTHVIGLENVRSLSDKLSDGLCKLTTGSGVTERKLFAQGEEWMAKVRNPVLINGIPANIIEQPDLLNRVITFRCDHLGDDVKSEETLERKFKAARPKLFGCILGGLVAALKFRQQFDDIDIAAEALFGNFHTRFIDVVVWNEVACRGMGFSPNEYFEAFKNNQRVTYLEVAKNSSICIGIRALMSRRSRWQGYPAQLCAELKRFDIVVPSEAWLGRELNWYINVLWELYRIRITRNNRLHKDGNRNGIIIELLDGSEGGRHFPDPSEALRKQGFTSGSSLREDSI
jgi:hypothetical protein